ncbi:hypothetical protein [Streptomyces sp. NPDC017940]|uniref:hypothetical protein n=1 Tax=Streptomyces sp. NPDC017940 TaxID=3365017 RepID=UPI0037B19FDD
MEILQIPDVERRALAERVSGYSAEPIVLGTLGPTGTSSEYVAGMMSRSVADRGRFRIVLEDTYEQCLDALIEEQFDLVLVAHAYSNINAFYMHPELEPATVFRGCTPEYGLATRKNFSFSRDLLASETVVSHPAPVPLLGYHFGRPVKTVTVDSTSQAADHVADGRYDLAITNEEAAEQYNLRFVYRFSRIPMTWTVFSRKKG